MKSSGTIRGPPMASANRMGRNSRWGDVINSLASAAASSSSVLSTRCAPESVCLASESVAKDRDRMRWAVLRNVERMRAIGSALSPPSPPPAAAAAPPQRRAHRLWRP